MASLNQNARSSDASEPISLDLMYRQHRAWLLRAVRRRFGHDQAEDLVQDVFIRAAVYAHDGVGNPRALLMQIATRAAIDRSRRAQVREVAHLDVNRACVEARQAEVLALKQAVLGLPDKFRRVLLLSRFGGLSNDEIATRCAISVKTVEWRMRKALRMCAAKLGPNARC